jgi:hypothetical protein
MLPPLAETERAFLLALDAAGVPFIVIGMGAAVLQGATAVTQDIDLWFADLTDRRIADAARSVGGIYVSGSFGMMPPTLGGALGDRFDVVTHAHGLGAFQDELAHTHALDVQGVTLRVLDLSRILASKQAARRPKDLAQIPVLEAAIAVRDEFGRPH